MAIVLCKSLTVADMKVIGRTANLMAMVLFIMLTAANMKVIRKKEV